MSRCTRTTWRCSRWWTRRPRRRPRRTTAPSPASSGSSSAAAPQTSTRPGPSSSESRTVTWDYLISKLRETIKKKVFYSFTVVFQIHHGEGVWSPELVPVLPWGREHQGRPQQPAQGRRVRDRDEGAALQADVRLRGAPRHRYQGILQGDNVTNHKIIRIQKILLTRIQILPRPNTRTCKHM